MERLRALEVLAGVLFFCNVAPDCTVRTAAVAQPRAGVPCCGHGILMAVHWDHNAWTLSEHAGDRLCKPDWAMRVLVASVCKQLSGRHLLALYIAFHIYT